MHTRRLPCRHQYKRLIVCPGLKLDWHAVDGLVETLGKNGVTSNYRYDLAPYTWQLVQETEERPRAVHPAAHADQVRRRAAKGHVSVGRSLAAAGVLGDIDIHFCNAGGAAVRGQGLRAGPDGLRETLRCVALQFFHNLVAIDGDGPQGAWFEVTEAGPAGPLQVEIAVRHDPRLPTADGTGLHPGLPAGRCRRLGRRRSGHPASQDPSTMSGRWAMS